MLLFDSKKKIDFSIDGTQQRQATAPAMRLNWRLQSLERKTFESDWKIAIIDERNSVYREEAYDWQATSLKLDYQFLQQTMLILLTKIKEPN